MLPWRPVATLPGVRRAVLVLALACASCSKCSDAGAPRNVPDGWVRSEDRTAGWEAWAPGALVPAPVAGAWVYKDGPTVVWKVSVEELACRPADDAQALERRFATMRKDAQPSRWEAHAVGGAPHATREVDWSDSSLGISVVRR